MAQAKTRGKQQPVGGNIFGFLLGLLICMAAAYYLIPLIMSGDPLWFSTSFTGKPSSITIIHRGERTSVDPADPRFAAITEAFNRSLKGGYRYADFGFSPSTWEQSDREGFLVELTYATPVRLHARGGFQPTSRMRLLIDGDKLPYQRVLFRSNPDRWDTLPLIVNNIDPLRQVLTQHGFGS